MKQPDKEWLEFVQASSIPLRKLDTNKLPVGIASGCMLDYLGKRLILSVFHATGKSGQWAVELRYDKENQRTELYYPGPFNFLAEMTLGVSEIREVDFSYAEIHGDITSFFQHLTPRGECAGQRPRIVFKPDFSVPPSQEELYAFSGQVIPQFVPDHNALITEHRTYPGLKYVRTENGYHYFELPVPHPGHDHFEGCSGAPIVDTERNVVALVCGGSEETNEIYGIALDKFKVALDVTYSDIL